MKYYGGLSENIKRAGIQARRMRGQPKSPDTLAFWAQLIRDGHDRLRAQPRQSSRLPELIAQLEEELALEGGVKRSA